MNSKKLRTPCLQCGKEPNGSSYKYCSNHCQQEYRYHCYIQKWKSGLIHGLSSIGTVTNPVKRYLREKYNNKCCLCGWSEVNVYTGKAPLIADHIDGNWRNNYESNLRLVCPNCDALSSTFSALNTGNGRPNRSISKRAMEAQQIARLAREKMS